VHPDPDCEDCGDSCPGKCSDPNQIHLCLNLTKIVKEVLPLPVGPLNLFDCNSEAKTEKQIENTYAVSESLEYYVHSEGNDILVYTMD